VVEGGDAYHDHAQEQQAENKKRLHLCPFWLVKLWERNL